MIDVDVKNFLEQLKELDTGKAQPLYHPFPVINIFREDGPVEENIPRERENQWEVDYELAMDKDGLTSKMMAMEGDVVIKGTFGLISRYGFDNDAPSLAQVTVAAEDVTALAKALEMAAEVDYRDPMSRDAYLYDYTEDLKNDLTGLKLAVMETPYGMEMDEDQIALFNQELDILADKGAEIEGTELDWEAYVLPVHHMIAACETVMTANGEDMEFLMEYEDLKDTAELGQYLLSEEAYEDSYLKALKVRSLIKDSFDTLLREYSALVVPYRTDMDTYTAGANLAGLPVLTLVFEGQKGDEESVLCGVHLIGGANQEKNLIQIAYALEQEVR